MKNKNNLLAILLIGCICAGNVPVQAHETDDENGNTYDINIVIEGEKTTAQVETRPGQLESVEAESTTEVIENQDGSTTTRTESFVEDFVTESGMSVDYKGSSVMTEIPAAPTEGETEEVPAEGETEEVPAEGETEEEDSLVVGNAKEYWIAVSPDGTYGANGGSIYETVEKAPEITVDIPLTDMDDPETEEKENVSSEETVPSGKVTEGDEKESETDGVYNYTTSETLKPGEVTVTTESITVTENADKDSDKLDYVVSETTPNAENDLVHAGDHAPEHYLPGYEGEKVKPEEMVEGYDYVYIGSGNTSKLTPAIVFTQPMDEEDKLAQFGENAYIKKNSITYYYVGCLKEEDKANIAKTESGDYVTDEAGYILDKDGNRIFKEELTTKGPNGETYYLRRFDKPGSGLYIEGWYENGEWVSDLNGDANGDGKKEQYLAVWAGPQQFVLVDSEGNTITTFCADFTTPTQDVYGYNVKNLEDATYYSEEDAEMIRSIAMNGYWGTVSDEVDENGNSISEFGSLDAIKEKLLASGQFTEEELESFNDGIALSATQMAIWSCSNKMTGITFVNSHYANWGAGDVPKDKEDEVKLLFKFYDYLMALEPTPAEGEKGEKTTANTIINEKNFIEDLELTVIGKDETNTNNQDQDKTNDAYMTEITFSLIVMPAEDNQDDLVVKVIGKDGQELASAYLASSDENQEVLTPDENGNYTLGGITLIEGESEFHISLEGIQKLEHGVYLYSSEVRIDEGSEESVSSQTLVGVTSGERAVNVSMKINFDLNVEDEIVATEQVWRNEWYTPVIPPEEPVTPPEEPVIPPEEPVIPPEEPVIPPEEPVTPPEEPVTPPEEPVTPPEEPVTPPEEPVTPPEDPVDPQVEEPEMEIIIEDEDIPLTDIPDEPIPQTGDSFFWHICSAIAALGLSAAKFFDKRRKNG